jgi:hypothetical protein
MGAGLMWFDAQAALAEIEGGVLPPSDPATVPRVAQVAQVARPPARNPETAPRADTVAADFKHGFAFDGRPRNWTGLVVSLAAWRDLSDWERHGPNGRHWNGITKGWEKPA